jgi:hypothetical protein
MKLLCKIRHETKVNANMPSTIPKIYSELKIPKMIKSAAANPPQTNE